MLQRLIDHFNRALHDLLAGGEHGLCLLAPQHHACDLRCISEVGELGFVDDDASHDEALLEFFAEHGRHLVSIGAQGGLGVLGVIVSKVRGDLAYGGFDLDVDKWLIGVDVKECRCGIRHAPDDDSCDLDRVAATVVHLELLARHIACAQRDLCHHVRGHDPAQARCPVGALVVSEQRDGCGLVGLQRVETAHREQGDEKKQPADDEQRHVPHFDTGPECPSGQDERQQTQQQDHDAVLRGRLRFHGPVQSLRRH
jgi:hypothetical protein